MYFKKVNKRLTYQIVYYIKFVVIMVFRVDLPMIPFTHVLHKSVSITIRFFAVDTFVSEK